MLAVVLELLFPEKKETIKNWNTVGKKIKEQAKHFNMNDLGLNNTIGNISFYIKKTKYDWRFHSNHFYISRYIESTEQELSKIEKILDKEEKTFPQWHLIGSSPSLSWLEYLTMINHNDKNITIAYGSTHPYRVFLFSHESTEKTIENILDINIPEIVIPLTRKIRKNNNAIERIINHLISRSTMTNKFKLKLIFSGLNSLDIKNGNLRNSQSIKDIADAIADNETINKLNLQGNKLDRQVEYIAVALEKNQSITDINLYDNEIDAYRAKSLADALKNNRTIENLNLGKNDIGNKGAEHIANAIKENNTLKEIDLSLNTITSTGITKIVNALQLNKSITNINLGFNHVDTKTTETIAELLKINTSIKQIDLSGTEINKDGAIALANAIKNNQSLSHIFLDWNEIKSEGGVAIAKSLKENDSISYINLTNNGLDESTKTLLRNIQKEKPKLKIDL